MLAKELEKKNCETYHASGDADVLIVVKAVEASFVTNTVLVSDGTDLLVLLWYHATRNIENNLFFVQSQRKISNQIKFITILYPYRIQGIYIIGGTLLYIIH